MFLHVSVCPQGGIGVVSQHALQVVSQHALQQVSRGVVSQHALQVSRPTPRGEVGDLARGWSQGPHPREKLRGIWPGGVGVSRPTPKGEVEGDLAGGSPGPHLSQHALRQTPPYSYWNAFLFYINVIVLTVVDIFFHHVNRSQRSDMTMIYSLFECS